MTSKKLKEEEILKIVKLARLQIEQDNLPKLTKEFNAILGYIKKLEEVNTDHVEAMSHVHGATNIFREDKIEDSMQIEDLLQNTPDRSGSFIRVPLVIEQE